MIAAQQIDSFGFPEAALRMSPVDLTRTSNDLANACQRGKALLRSLHYQLVNDHGGISLSDVEALVELALSALPDYEGEAFNDIEQFDMDARQTMRKLMHQQQALTALLDAMELAARPGASLDEMKQTATTIYDNAALLTDGERHWQAFCELMSERGLLLVWVDFGNGLPPRPDVHTPESLQAARHAQRKFDAYLRAVHQPSASTSTPPARRKKAASRH